MARLVDGAEPLSGGALASRLHGHTKHGDLAMASFVQRVMDSVCEPLYNMLSRCLQHNAHKNNNRIVIELMISLNSNVI